ncbi:hypothetical protein PIROE2DRAFT_11137 [Piromyces sp. E2]|nr:hypothetical protein PIROE2DRAFT_11137 [Piromyces sp. E2]|eukprot:OUM62554.1 hypothetical protein PIROE2DRAFT_11137 [Piromyces sp. E2]
MVCDILSYRNDFGAINLLSKANMEWFVSLMVACGLNRTPKTSDPLNVQEKCPTKLNASVESEAFCMLSWVLNTRIKTGTASIIVIFKNFVKCGVEKKKV